jgi:ubiquinone/menaquinone biosynthesis C-methylase UbiE
MHEQAVSKHYQHGDLLGSIHTAITKMGKTDGDITVEDLAPVDEFHIGGRSATENLLNQLDISTHSHLLDVGCGLGGAARLIADRYNNRVTGIDLMQEYIDTGNALCEWVSLQDRVTLKQGSALAMPFPDGAFDVGIMIHVGMNIDDKAQLFAEVHRVLRPGAQFGIYDIMRQNDGDLAFPVPWAAEPDTSSLATSAQYKQALREAGFSVSKENDRSGFAIEFFHQMRKKMETNGGPPTLGLHTLMKETTADKSKNMIENLTASLIAPVEIIAQRG